MQDNTNAAAAGAAAAPRKASKLKGNWIASVVGRVLTLMSMVAPGPALNTMHKQLFTPAHPRGSDAAKAALRAGKAEDFTVDGASVRRYRWGTGSRRVLLVHGWSGDAAQMTAFVEPLVAQGCEVIAVDLPAHGASEGKLSSVAHFQKTMLQLHRELGPLHAVVAHSLGAAAFVSALAQGMTCERAVLVSPICSYDTVWGHSQQILQISRRLTDKARAHAETWLGIRFDAMEPLKLAPGFGATRLLVIQDRGDRESPVEESERLAAVWPGARIVVTDKLGHTRILRDAGVTQQAADFIAQG
jgi:pimeloyl-ACP methyl ester carboxylesterase